MKALAPQYAIEPLASHHDRGQFDCGVETLDRYLRQQASQNARKNVAAVFVAVLNGSPAVLGFYTLAMAAVRLHDLPAETARRLPRYPAVPAVRLGRLAVDVSARGQGVGALLLIDALHRALRSEIAWTAVVVDAKDAAARGFYAKFGFTPLADSELNLYLLRSAVAEALA